MELVTKRRIGAAIAVLALAAGGMGVAGCGGDSPSAVATSTTAAATTAADNGIASLGAAEILAKASAAAKQASSVRISGDVTQNGKPLSMNLMVGNDASQGTLGLNGQQVDVRLVNNTFYMRAPAAFYESLGTSGAALAKLVAGRWFSVSLDGSGAADQLAAFETFTNKDKLFGSFLDLTDQVSVKGTGDVAGQPVVFVADGTNGTLAVATTGEPYPIQIAGGGNGTTGTLKFTDWNATVHVTAPPGVLDLGGLLGTSNGGSGTTTSTGN